MKGQCDARDGYGDNCGRPVVPNTLYCEPCLVYFMSIWQEEATKARARLTELDARTQSAEEALEAHRWSIEHRSERR